MKKSFISTMVLGLLLVCTQAFAQSDADLDRNKEIAVKYHELNQEDVDALFAEDFTAWSNEMAWNRESHRQALGTSHKQYKSKDKILYMVAEGDLVAVKFVRTAEMNGKEISVDVMQFMRIEDGKIVELWELYDPGQVDSQME